MLWPELQAELERAHEVFTKAEGGTHWDELCFFYCDKDGGGGIIFKGTPGVIEIAFRTDMPAELWLMCGRRFHAD